MELPGLQEAMAKFSEGGPFGGASDESPETSSEEDEDQEDGV